MLSTASISGDVDLLWFKDKSSIYLKLSNFFYYLQIYVEKNHVDDATNAKPFDVANVANVEVFDVAHDEVGDVVIIFL